MNTRLLRFRDPHTGYIFFAAITEAIVRPYIERTPMLFRNRELRMRMVRTNDTEASEDLTRVQVDPEQISELAKDFVHHSVKVVTGGFLVVIAGLILRDTVNEVVKAGFR